MKKIENQIAEYLYNFYYGINKTTCTLYSVLEYIADNNKLSINKLRDANNYDVKGNDGYKIVLFTLIVMKKLEKRGIIFYHKQGEASLEFNEIEGCQSSEVAKISGDFARYITDFHSYAIYVDESIKEFKRFGFANLELKEARKQTKKASCTLIIAIISLICSILIPILTKC